MAISMAMLNYHMVVVIQNFRNHPECPSEERGQRMIMVLMLLGCVLLMTILYFSEEQKVKELQKDVPGPCFQRWCPVTTRLPPQDTWFTLHLRVTESVRFVFLLFCHVFPIRRIMKLMCFRPFSGGRPQSPVPAPAWCQDVKLKEELDGLKKNIANDTRTLVDIILLSWEVL